MRLLIMLTLLSLSLFTSGCVTLSTYNEKVGEAEALKKDLAASEAAGKAVDAELQLLKQGLARLRQQHEQIKTDSVAGSDISAGKKTFATDLEWLAAKLDESAARIEELSASLAAQEDATRKMASGEAVAERDRQIRDLQAKLEELQREKAELSQKRLVSGEKEEAVAAVRAALKSELDRGEVQLREYRDKMIVSLPEQVIFESGSATISKKGQRVLKRMAAVLKKIGNNQIRVEGHTDSAPIGRKIVGRFPTNWDLAAARATSVVKYLQSRGKLDSRLLALAGYGPNVPAAANNTERGRKQNRRIEIALVPFEKQDAADNGK